ncbi:MAG: hypothetical protein SGJ20_08190 [Planctomycetota bacterium]|nr:hypothetical protein [Planctomycetota bacterium]
MIAAGLVGLGMTCLALGSMLHPLPISKVMEPIGGLLVFPALGCFAYWLFIQFFKKEKPPHRHPWLTIGAAGLILFSVIGINLPGFRAARNAATLNYEAQVDQQAARTARNFDSWIDDTIVGPRIEQIARARDLEIDRLPIEQQNSAQSLYGLDWSQQMKLINRAALPTISEYAAQLAREIYQPADLHADLETFVNKRSEMDRRFNEPVPIAVEQAALAATESVRNRALKASHSK